MPVEPAPCPPGGGDGPAPAETCCAPAIASTSWCLADGSPILVLVRSGCAECGTPGDDPQIAGWLDPATGTFTPGPAPADAGPCDTGCVETVCVTRCDDTDGDGAADATYTELWCVRGDGTSTLVFTYQGDDLSQPYVPVAPMECTWADRETLTLPLCDDSGPFLRRYTFVGGTATFEDVQLDGRTPHPASGTPRPCGGDDCQEQTTPAATLGLCLADGTPIAVVVTRDCQGTVTRDGWIDLTTGAYSPGAPPAGAIACGDSRSIQVSGTFCDLNVATGEILGLVLIEYSYDADGAIGGVRLVDAVTGGTYTPTGEISVCPAGVEQPEQDLAVLCDTAPDGSVTTFVRDFRRDENGQIVGHTDYDLDGGPYTVAGTVGQCPQESACRDCTTQILCDTDAMPAATIAGTAASGTLPNGVVWTATGPLELPPNQQGDGAAWWGPALLPNPAVPLTTFTFDQPVTAEFSVLMVYSTGTAAGENTAQLPAGAEPVSLPPGYTFDRATSVLRVNGTLNDCTVLDAPTRENSARFRVTGVSSFAVQYLGARTPLPACRRVGSWLFGAVDVSFGGQFQRTTCRDCDGEVTSVTDTLLDGATPYTPTGTVALCGTSQAEPCRNATTTLLCDVSLAETINVMDTVTRQDADGWTITSYTDSGCVINDGIPEPPFSPYWVEKHSGCLSAVPDAYLGDTCWAWDWNTAPIRYVLTKTFDALQDGRATVTATGVRADGGARVRVNGVDAGLYATYTEDAANGDVTVPISAGPNVVEIEVRDIGGPNWVGGQLDVAVTVSTQFFRHQVVDCETGATVAVTDTTLDGAPYTVSGQVGQCETAGGETAPPCQHCQTVPLCDQPAAEELVPGTSGVLASGVTWALTAGEQVPGEPWWQDGPAGVPAFTFSAPVSGEWSVRLPGGDACMIMPAGAVPVTVDPGHTWDAATRRLCSVPGTGTAESTSVFATSGPVTELVFGTASGIVGGHRVGLIGVTAGDAAGPVEFLRTICRDCGGAVTAVSDTALDGTTPYTPTGAVGVCGPPAAEPAEPEPCRDTTSVLLCDASAEQVPATPALTDTALVGASGVTPPPIYIKPLPGAYTALWGGGVLSFPAEPDGAAGDGVQIYRAATGQLSLAETCEGGTATVTVSVRVENLGPGWGVANSGRMELWNGAVFVAASQTLNSTRTGEPQTLSLTGQVPVDDIKAGLVTVVLWLETFHTAPKAWRADQFTVDAELGGCAVQFLRTVTVDCETGEVLTTSDTTLDGQPYEVTGTVGQCATVGGQCCPPERRVDVEPQALCLVDEASGDVVGRVLVELVYDDQTGDLIDRRLVDALTGEPLTVPDGTVIGSCESPCPTAFSTECVGVVARSEAAYDNTSLIGGQPGQCGSVQGPADAPASGASFSCDAGPYTITSWIVDGVEVIGDGSGRAFNGGPCGPGTDTNPGMHRNWAEALTNLDPTGATWVVDSAPGCAYYIRSEGGTGTLYGPMTITGDGAAVPDGTWILGAAQSCEETKYTRVYRQDCDGSISVVWLDKAGQEIPAPDGEFVPCGTGCSPRGGQGLDVEALTLCDVGADGERTPFLRHITYDTGGAVAAVADTGLDGFTPYTPAGEVSICSPEPAPYTTQVCRCDDTDGDGIGDTDYVEVVEIDADGAMTTVGTYNADMSAPYEPVNPVECPVQGAPPVHGVRAGRVELADGSSWNAAGVPLLQSVTAAAHGGTGTITTADGTTTLFQGESVTWSVVRDDDAMLTGPLTIAAQTGTVTISYTQGVLL